MTQEARQSTAPETGGESPHALVDDSRCFSDEGLEELHIQIGSHRRPTRAGDDRRKKSSANTARNPARHLAIHGVDGVEDDRRKHLALIGSLEPIPSFP